MKEILQQILNSNQDSPVCFWVVELGQITGKIQSITNEYVVLDGGLNHRSKRFWTTVIKLEYIIAIDFRSDVRSLTTEECLDMGLPCPEENTND